MNQSIVDLSQLNLEKMIREIGEEEVVRIWNIIIENSTKILKMQKILLMLEKEEQRKREQREMEKRDYNEKQKKEEQRRRKKKRRRREKKNR